MSRTLNHPAFRRPPGYISGGIYAHAHSGVPPTRTPSAPHSWDAATPVAVHFKILGLACNTRHYRPQLRRSTQTPHLYCGTRHWKRDTLLQNISSQLKGIILPKQASSRFRHQPYGQIQKQHHHRPRYSTHPRLTVAGKDLHVNRSHLSCRDICEDTQPS